QHVEESVKRILIAKYRAGLAAPVRIEESGVTAALNKEMESVWKQVAQSAITVVQDKNNIVGNLKSGNTVAYVALGNSSEPEIISDLKANGLKVSMSAVSTVLTSPDRYDAIIVGIQIGRASCRERV